MPPESMLPAFDCLGGNDTTDDARREMLWNSRPPRTNCFGVQLTPLEAELAKHSAESCTTCRGADARDKLQLLRR